MATRQKRLSMLMDADLVRAGHRYAKLKRTTLTGLIRNYLATKKAQLASEDEKALSRFMVEETDGSTQHPN